MAVIAWPVVNRDEILAVYQPGAPRTPARLQTLRRHRAVSEGIRVSIRSGARLRGQERWYSTLNLDAAILVRRGEHEAAVRAAAAAGELERRWSAELVGLGLSPADIAPGSNTQPDLIAAFAAEAEQKRTALDLVIAETKVITGHFVGVQGQWAMLLTTFGEPLALPEGLLSGFEIAVGGALAILVEHLADAVVLRPMFAVDVGQPWSLPPAGADAPSSADPDGGGSDDDLEVEEAATAYLAALDEPVELTAADIELLESSRARGEGLRPPDGWIALVG